MKLLQGVVTGLGEADALGDRSEPVVPKKGFAEFKLGEQKVMFFSPMASDIKNGDLVAVAGVVHGEVFSVRAYRNLTTGVIDKRGGSTQTTFGTLTLILSAASLINALTQDGSTWSIVYSGVFMLMGIVVAYSGVQRQRAGALLP